jgi:CheY-like chemotaxis protein
MTGSSTPAGPDKAPRTPPLAVVCAPEAITRALADRLRRDGMVVYVTHDMHGCLRVATSIAPDLIVLDPRLPRRLVRLLRAHPASSGSLLRWTSDFDATAPAPRVASVA